MVEKGQVKGVDGPADSNYNLINQLGKGPKYSMHMPGHCGNNEVTPILNQFLKEYGGNAIEGTTDEVFGTLGNYFPPSGIMKKSLDQAAELYGTKCTYYGINGSTGNLISATRCLGGNKQVALLQRNTHRSVAHGFRISGARLRFSYPDYDEEHTLFKPLTLDQIKAEVEQNCDITVVVVTTPTYEGLTADVPAIAAYCKLKGLRLLIDGAHGSIFPFHDQMPHTGIGIDGVDIVVQSLHKAAGAFSQASVIHLNKTSSIDRTQLETALFITASTSPSNLLLASIEEVIVRNFSKEGKDMISKVIGFATQAKDTIRKLPGYQLWEFPGIPQDPTKVCFDYTGPNGKKLTGEQIRNYFREHFSVDPEEYTPTSVLFSFHIGTTEATLANFLAAAQTLHTETEEKLLFKCRTLCEDIRPHAFHKNNSPLQTPVYAVDLQECFQLKVKSYPAWAIKQSLESDPYDKQLWVSAQIISPCPPGCIVVDIGEKIKLWHFKFLDPQQELLVFEVN